MMFSGIILEGKNVEILKEILKEENINDFSETQQCIIADNLIEDYEKGLSVERFKELIKISGYQENGIVIDGIEEYNAEIVRLSSNIVDLDYKIGMLENGKQEYKTLYEDTKRYVEFVLNGLISTLNDDEKKELLNKIIDKEIKYNDLFKLNPELYKKYLSIDEIKNNKTIDGNMLANNNIITSIQAIEKHFKYDNSHQEQLFRDFAYKNIRNLKSFL